jgi:hypothetical protein
VRLLIHLAWARHCPRSNQGGSLVNFVRLRPSEVDKRPQLTKTVERSPDHQIPDESLFLQVPAMW